MRIVFASLIAAAGLSGVAHAQDAAPASDPAATAAAPMAPAPEATPAAPAAEAAPAAPAPEAAPAPAAEAAAPAPVAEAAPEEPPLPPIPTTGDGGALLSILEKICVPSVRGQKLDDLAKANGFKLNRRMGTWSAPLNGNKAYTVTLLPQGSNKDACIAEVQYALGQDAPIITALNIWSSLHDPRLNLAANYVAVDADGIKRVRKSWEDFGANHSMAVNFTIETKPDDSPLNPRYSFGKMFYQERKF